MNLFQSHYTSLCIHTTPMLYSTVHTHIIPPPQVVTERQKKSHPSSSSSHRARIHAKGHIRRHTERRKTPTNTSSRSTQNAFSQSQRSIIFLVHPAAASLQNHHHLLCPRILDPSKKRQSLVELFGGNHRVVGSFVTISFFFALTATNAPERIE